MTLISLGVGVLFSAGCVMLNSITRFPLFIDLFPFSFNSFSQVHINGLWTPLQRDARTISPQPPDVADVVDADAILAIFHYFEVRLLHNNCRSGASYLLSRKSLLINLLI
jgi:hypothetical protein